ncbi:MAG: heme lyase CcmF/NrfE family subunit [Pseudomonadota bacterium]
MMVNETGHFAIILALICALIQGISPLLGRFDQSGRFASLSVPAALSCFLCLGVAACCLVAAFIGNDFSNQLVQHHSHSLQPMIYRIAASWGNHEGSLLLWVIVLGLFSAILACARQIARDLRDATLAVQGLVMVAFLALLIFTSNPFVRLFPAPIEGRELNPLLQDPGLALHPPGLYLGYVGLSVVFSFAIAALIIGRVDRQWASLIRPWCRVAWALLSAGIGLGSWWAYHELGWGGFWFWDPVENASLMPWLLATALMHSAMVSAQKGAMLRWTVFLAIAAFSCSLIGTFIVRSGIMTSVHAFTNDPTRGIFVLLLLLVAIGGSLLLYAVRAPKLGSGNLFALFSREGALVLNNLLLGACFASVIIGTFYPLVLEGITAEKLSVGPPYYAITFIPIWAAVMLVMAVAPLLGWRRAVVNLVWRRIRWALCFSALGVIAFYFSLGNAIATLGFGICTWVIILTLTALWRRIKVQNGPWQGGGIRELATRIAAIPAGFWSMVLAHLGVALFAVGVIGVTILGEEQIARIKAGERLAVGGSAFVLQTIEQIQGPNYRAVRATLQGQDGVVLRPENRIFMIDQRITTEAATHSTALRDLYAVLGRPDATGTYWVVRLYIRPLALWLWIGAGFMTIAGLLPLVVRFYPSSARRWLKISKAGQP